MERVKLSKAGLAQDIENGLTRKEIANKYGLVQGQLNKAMVQAGLKGVKAKTVKFEFVEDEPVVEEPIIEMPVPDLPAEISEEVVGFGTRTSNGLPINDKF